MVVANIIAATENRKTVLKIILLPNY